MNLNRIILAGALAGCLLAVESAVAFTPDNPYTYPITNRNLFGLKPPPDPNDPANQPPPPPLRKIELSGITTILGKKMAVLRVARTPKPGEAPQVSVMLGEGAPAEENVEVLQINLTFGTSGFNLVGSQYPIGGSITNTGSNTLNFPSSFPTGTRLYTYDTISGYGFVFKKSTGAWNANININVGQGFFVNNPSNTPQTWIQNVGP